MKFMFASDIHGSAFYAKKVLEIFEKEKAERLILLGDILYHGPRNDLPRDYSPKEVILMLNSICDKILCVRGNCDTEHLIYKMKMGIKSEKKYQDFEIEYRIAV